MITDEQNDVLCKKLQAMHFRAQKAEAEVIKLKEKLDYYAQGHPPGRTSLWYFRKWLDSRKYIAELEEKNKLQEAEINRYLEAFIKLRDYPGVPIISWNEEGVCFDKPE